MSIIYINPFQFATAAAYDPDAQDYINRVIAADVAAGDTSGLEVGVQDAINDFFVGCKSDGIFSALKASCILAGARTQNGAMVPLISTIPGPTMFGAAGGWNYNRKTGLQGNGTDNYFNTNRPDDADPQNDKHYSIYVPNGLSPGSTAMLGALATSPNKFTQIVTQPADILFALNSSSSVFVPPVSATGLIGASRSTSSAISVLSNSVVGTYSLNSVAASNLDIFLFARNLNGTAQLLESKPLAFYSIGESLDLTLLDARVTTLINAIGAAIP